MDYPWPVPTVTLLRYGTVFWQGVSDANGNYSAPNLPAANYTLIVAKAGFQTLRDNIAGMAGGNGNLHVNLLPRAEDPAQDAAALEALDRLFDLVLSLGGTLSGEHGIGMVKRAFMARAITPATLDVMRAIKRQFDPQGILNPGKLLPD